MTIVEKPRDDYSTIFTEPKENNCCSIIAQVIIRAIAFSFILRVSSSKKKTARNFDNKCFSINYLARVIIARYDVILDQSELASL